MWREKKLSNQLTDWCFFSGLLVYFLVSVIWQFENVPRFDINEHDATANDQKKEISSAKWQHFEQAHTCDGTNATVSLTLASYPTLNLYYCIKIHDCNPFDAIDTRVICGRENSIYALMVWTIYQYFYYYITNAASSFLKWKFLDVVLFFSFFLCTRKVACKST